MKANDRPHHSEWIERNYPIQEDMRFQRASWTVQRWGWSGMVVLVLVALAGLFSNGPLSHTTVSSADGRVSVEAERFQRIGAPASWTVRLRPAGAETELRIGGRFPSAFTIESMAPAPLRATGSTEGLTFVFDSSEVRDSLVVRLSARPEEVGPAPSRFVVSGGTSAEIAHFIYP